jgi:hypothetical protein
MTTNLKPFEIVRFDLQVLNEFGAPIQQFDCPKYELKRALERIIASLEKGEVYAINLKKQENKTQAN